MLRPSAYGALSGSAQPERMACVTEQNVAPDLLQIRLLGADAALADSYQVPHLVGRREGWIVVLICNRPVLIMCSHRLHGLMGWYLRGWSAKIDGR
jgi:hypothetical protein